MWERFEGRGREAALSKVENRKEGCALVAAPLALLQFLSRRTSCGCEHVR